MTGLFLLLGSNLGDKSQHLIKAQALIKQLIGPIVEVSSVYHTEPWGMSGVPEFLNQVVRVDTNLNPMKILELIQTIESRLGRSKSYNYESRTIDIDILYYNHLILQHPDLIIPHPRIITRKFVLLPLAEVAPQFKHPILGLTNKQLLARCEDKLVVQVSH